MNAYRRPTKNRQGSRYVCPVCAANARHDYIYLRKLDGGLDCKRCRAMWDGSGQMIALPYGEEMPVDMFDLSFAEYEQEAAR